MHELGVNAARCARRWSLVRMSARADATKQLSAPLKSRRGECSNTKRKAARRQRTTVKSYSFTQARLAQSVERKALNLVVVGSSPTVGVCTRARCTSFRHQRARMNAITPLESITVDSGVAQWLACWAHNPKVRGSKPRSAICVWLPRAGAHPCDYNRLHQ